MGRSRTPASRSRKLDTWIQKHVMGRRFPSFTSRRQDGTLIFEGSLQPFPGRAVYRVAVHHRHGCHPKVWITEPQIHEEAPHRYGDESLCLYHPGRFRWTAFHLVGVYIIPWVVMWLVFYEGWLKTGLWSGLEAPHENVPKSPRG